MRREPTRSPEELGHAFVEELGARLVTLAADLERLTHMSTVAPPRDPSTMAAVRAFGERVGALETVRESLADLLTTVPPELVAVFAANEPLGEYLHGLHAWLDLVVEAFDTLAEGIYRMHPDWTRFRGLLERAKELHFVNLEEEIVSSIVDRTGASSADEESAGGLLLAVDALLRDARALQHQLDEPLG